jgi:hypothetical protein
MNNFADGLAEIAKRLEGYSDEPFVISLAVYDGEKNEWTLKIRRPEQKREAANESN